MRDINLNHRPGQDLYILPHSLVAKYLLPSSTSFHRDYRSRQIFIVQLMISEHGPKTECLLGSHGKQRDVVQVWNVVCGKHLF